MNKIPQWARSRQGIQSRIKLLSRSTALLTPWGIQESRNMSISDISFVFGRRAGEFVHQIRSGHLRGVRL